MATDPFLYAQILRARSRDLKSPWVSTNKALGDILECMQLSPAEDKTVKLNKTAMEREKEKKAITAYSIHELGKAAVGVYFPELDSPLPFMSVNTYM